MDEAEQEIRALIRGGENLAVEFKSDVKSLSGRDLVADPRSRNPLLVDIIKRIGLTERTGRGKRPPMCARRGLILSSKSRWS